MRALLPAGGRRVGAEIVRRFHADTFAMRSVAQVTGGTAIAQVIAIVVSPFLTRLYTPTDFGVYAAAMTIVSLALVMSSLRYSTAIPIPVDDETAANLIVLSTIAVLITTTILAVALALFGASIAAALGSPGLASILWIVVVAEFAGALYEVVIRWAICVRVFATIAKTNILQGSGIAAGQFGFGILGVGPAGLVVGDAIGRIAATSGLAGALRGTMGPAFGSVSRSAIWRAAARYWRFPLISGPGALLNTLNVLAPTILLLALYGPEVGGSFALAQRVGLIPIRLLGSSVAQVYTGELTRQLARERAGVRGLFLQTVKHLAAGGIVPVAALAVGGPLLFPTVFGPQWREAGIYLALFAPTSLALFVWNPVSGTLDILERQKLGMWAELFALIIVTGVVMTGFATGVGPTGAVLLLSLATALGTCLALAVTWYGLWDATRSPRLDDPAGGTP